MKYSETSTQRAKQRAEMREAQLKLNGENITLSNKTIGFTSAMKLGFVHHEFDSSEINYVSTEFPCSVRALNNPDKSVIVELDGALTAVSKDEAEFNKLTEITLKLSNNQWIDARVPTPEQIKKARARAGLTQSQAAAVIYKQILAWQRYESGDRVMDAAYYELFLIKTGQMKL